MNLNCKMPWKSLLIQVNSAVFLYSCLIRFTVADVVVLNRQNITEDVFPDFSAAFSPHIPSNGIQGKLVVSDPDNACSDVAGPPHLDNQTSFFLLVKRYGCTFQEKALRAAEKGYEAVIIYNIETNIIEPFGQKDSNIYIPTVLVGKSDGITLGQRYLYDSGYSVLITAQLPFNLNNYLLPFAIVVAVCFVMMLVFTIVKCIRDRRRSRRNRLPSKQLKKIPVKKYKKGDQYDVCAICLDDYCVGDKLRILPCSHAYHTRCIDPWLTNNKRTCPVCKRKVFVKKDAMSDDSDSDDDGSRTSERTPLLSSTQSAPAGQTNYSYNTSLLTRADQEEAGPSSLPSDRPTSIEHEVQVVIVPSIHSVNNGDESDSAGEAATVQTFPETPGGSEAASESRPSGNKKKLKKRGDFVV